MMCSLNNRHNGLLSLLGIAILVFLAHACEEAGSVSGVQDRTAAQAMDTMKVYTVQITGVSLHPIDKEHTGQGAAFSWSDTLNNQLKFEAEPEYMILDSTVVTRRNMEERLSYEVINPVVSTKANSVFNFDKPIKFRDMRISAGRNFLADSLVAEHVDFPAKLHPEGRAQLEMDQDHFIIPPRKYTVQATWKTEKGEIFTDTTRVFINLR